MHVDDACSGDGGFGRGVVMTFQHNFEYRIT